MKLAIFNETTGTYEPIVTRDEAARRLGLTDSSVRVLTHRGRLNGLMVLNQRMFTVKEVNAELARRAATASTAPVYHPSPLNPDHCAECRQEERDLDRNNAEKASMVAKDARSAYWASVHESKDDWATERAEAERIYREALG